LKIARAVARAAGALSWHTLTRVFT
jgi:hypothetical protein